MRLTEIFLSVQGEGLNTGCPAVFIRLAGCNLACSWCDTNHEVRREDTPENIATNAANVSYKSGVKFFVVTGGEPTEQNEELKRFVSILRLMVNGATIALETNGTNDILPGLFDFVSVSPKGESECWNFANLTEAHEVKLVIAKVPDEEKMVSLLSEVAKVLWLQPEGDKLINLDRCYELAMGYPKARVGHQMHKIRGWL